MDEDALLVDMNPERHAAASLYAIARRIDGSRSDTGTADMRCRTGWTSCELSSPVVNLAPESRFRPCVYK